MRKTLILGEMPVDDLVQIARRRRSVPNGFSMMMRRQPRLGRRRVQLRRAQLLDDAGVARRRDREIVEHSLAVELPKAIRQPLIDGRIGQRPADVIRALDERSRDVVVLLDAGELAQAGFELSPESVVAEVGAADPDHGKARRQTLAP